MLPHPEVRLHDRKEEEFAERRKAISEAFHSFHQPLTSLHCGLELALYKPRTEAEYKKRIEDALVNAGVILRLNKAMRELVDAADPGERFGTVELAPLLAQLREQVSITAEAEQVALRWSGEAEARVAADPMKLLQMLGNVISFGIGEMQPGTEIHVSFTVASNTLTLRMSGRGDRLPEREPSDIEQKLREIRLDAARCYCRTLNGKLTVCGSQLEIAMPVLA
jgi:signal transduction histidine kinase